jgi:hypothetical protein
MSDIFISYTREDESKAGALAQFLQRQDWSVWWDRNIRPGHGFSQIIEGEMSSAKALIVLWSKHSILSNWVKDEAQEGVRRGILIPVLIENVDLPLGFRQFQAVKLIKWDGVSPHPGLEGLLGEVAQLIGKQPPVGLKLNLTDVYGINLKEKVDIALLNKTIPNSYQMFRRLDASKEIVILGLQTAPQGNYQVSVFPTTYLPTRRKVNINAVGMTEMHITLPIDPARINTVSFLAYKRLPKVTQALLEGSAEVYGFEGKSGKDLYLALDDIRKANLLNAIAKLQSEMLTNGNNILSYLQELKEIRGDRLLTVVHRELLEAIESMVTVGQFFRTSSVLHQLPPKFTGYRNEVGFKTADMYGAVQLSFFMSGDNCVADVDLDEADGMKHIFQNPYDTSLRSTPSHPYYLHEILVASEKIDPGYQLNPVKIGR